MKRCVLTLALILAFLPKSFGATWTDPNLEQLIEISPFIGVIEASKAGPKEHIQIFKVTRTYRGKKIPEIISVTGFFDPERQAAPKIPAGTRFVAFLNPKGKLWRPATPSYGLFPIRGDAVLASARDTSLRVVTKLDNYERFIKAVLAHKESKKSTHRLWLRKQRANIDAAPLLALKKEQAAELHISLEALYYFATKDDLPRLKRLLRCDLFQIRASAVRALGTINNEAAGQLLFTQLFDDSKDTVKCWSAMSLARLSPFPKALSAKLVEKAEKLSENEVRLHRSVEDPRKNALPAPRASIALLMGKIKEVKALPFLYKGLESEDEELIKASLVAILDFEDLSLIRKVIERMREETASDYQANQYFVAALRRITGQKLGRSKKAWLSWWDKNKSSLSPKKGQGQTQKGSGE